MRDWDHLMTRAEEARAQAHAPYSRFRVGCAIEDEEGRIHAGCNVENASYGLTMCAERVAVGALVAAGGRRIRRVALVTDAEAPVAPCGACRQVLAEFSDGMEVRSRGTGGAVQRWGLQDLLPDHFRFPGPPAA